MFITLTTSQAADMLNQDKNNGFTYAGARALVEFIESIENETDPIELDLVELRCNYSQYESFQDWAEEYFGEAVHDLVEQGHIDSIEDETIRQFITHRTNLIEFTGGIIIENF